MEKRVVPAPARDVEQAWGVPPWRVATRVPAAALPDRVDVAVVGGGFTGLSAAYHLARAGVPVALLEAGRIGAGASGRTGGIVLEGTATGPLDRVTDCVDGLARLAAEAAIDCDLQLDGCWEIAHAVPGGSRVLAWSDGDAAVDVVETVPGGSVDPGALVSGLADAALAAGASVHETTPVATLAREPSPILVLADGRRVRCGRVVLALNAYTPALVPLRTFTPALTYAIATVPVDEALLAAIGLAARRPFYTIDLPYLWGRVTTDRRLIFGAGLSFDAAADLTRLDLTQAGPAVALARLEERVRGLHPQLASIRIEHRWGGPIAFLRDRPPLLGWYGESRDVLVSGGYAGHGVALSVRAGALAAAAIAGGATLPPWGALPD
jgi:gamma-glutamylputrescine oxidase